MWRWKLWKILECVTGQMYGKTRAVDIVPSREKGEVLGLLGPNGAGKDNDGKRCILALTGLSRRKGISRQGDEDRLFHPETPYFHRF